jgi:hypothetical protein
LNLSDKKVNKSAEFTPWRKTGVIIINYYFMKNICLVQMEQTKGGFDCSTESQLATIAGFGVGGAFGGPFGFLAGIYVGTAYSIYKCY